MKKFSLLIAAASLAVSAFAAVPPSYVIFSSTGPDTYADGTTVLDGEVYALVWTRSATFAGFNQDGSLVDPVNDKVIALAPIADKGRCPAVMYILPGDMNSDKTSGSYSVYLLDTRIAAADGTKTVAGVSTDGTLVTINTVAAVRAKVAAGSKQVVEEAVATGAGDAAVAIAEANIPKPVVKAIKVVGGKVIVQVADTVPYLQYGISAGENPAQLDETELVEGVSGTTDGNLTIIVDNPDKNRFFKIVEKKVFGK